MTDRTHRPTPSDTPGDDEHIIDPLDLATLVADGVIDVIAGDPLVPLTVIRLADIDQASISSTDTAGSFAELLLALYTRLGDTVVTLEDDPTLAGVCGANGRRYLHATHHHGQVTGSGRITDAALVLVRWPAGTDTDDDDAALTELFRSCRRMLRRDGKVIVAVVGHGSDAHLYIRQARHLMPAAYTAGLGYFQRLITVFAPILGERASRHASPADPATLRRATHISVHGDTVAFTIRRRGRHA